MSDPLTWFHAVNRGLREALTPEGRERVERAQDATLGEVPPAKLVEGLALPPEVEGHFWAWLAARRSPAVFAAKARECASLAKVWSELTGTGADPQDWTEDQVPEGLRELLAKIEGKGERVSI